MLASRHYNIDFVCLLEVHKLRFPKTNRDSLVGRQTPEKKRAGALTGLECSTVKKSGLVRNLALGDWSSSVRRDLELD